MNILLRGAISLIVGLTFVTGVSRSEKNHYKAKVADAKYRKGLTSSREGLNITSNELKKMGDIISPLVLKGQSLLHIFTHHKNEINCCERTLYYYFDKNAFTDRNIDLPRKMKYKSRKKSIEPVIKESSYKIGRTFDDFGKFIVDNPNIPVVEMDVKNAIDKLYEVLGHGVFKRSFPVILTDNGSEFKNPQALELDNEGNQRTKIFYCNPMASY